MNSARRARGPTTGHLGGGSREDRSVCPLAKRQSIRQTTKLGLLPILLRSRTEPVKSRTPKTMLDPGAPR